MFFLETWSKNKEIPNFWPKKYQKIALTSCSSEFRLQQPWLSSFEQTHPPWHELSFYIAEHLTHSFVVHDFVVCIQMPLAVPRYPLLKN
jgi:hypothetical protein